MGWLWLCNTRVACLAWLKDCLDRCSLQHVLLLASPGSLRGLLEGSLCTLFGTEQLRGSVSGHFCRGLDQGRYGDWIAAWILYGSNVCQPFCCKGPLHMVCPLHGAGKCPCREHGCRCTAIAPLRVCNMRRHVYQTFCHRVWL